MTPLDKVVDKIFEDQCFGLLICPVESGAQWFYRMQFISFYWIDLPSDVNILLSYSGIPIPPVGNILFRVMFFHAYGLDPDTLDDCQDFTRPSFEVRGTIESSKPDDCSLPFVAKLQKEFQDVLTNPKVLVLFHRK